MIEWVYESALDLSVLIALILLIRNPVRRLLGAHISYWLWSLLPLRLLLSNQFTRPDVIIQHIPVPKTSQLMPLYSGPMQASATLIDVLFWIWLSGVVLWCGFRLVLTRRCSAHLHHHSEAMPHSWSVTEGAPLISQGRIGCRVCHVIQGPMITGLIKPTIYVPADFFEHYDLTQRQLILAHEITHAKRWDLWFQLLAEVLRAVFWFNPLIHLAWSRFQQDQEYACDHHILKQSDNTTRIAYGQAMIKGMGAFLLPGSLNFFNHKHERFIMLSKHKNSLFLSLAGLLVISGIAWLTLTRTAVSLDEKTTAENGQLVSYEFNDIPLMTVAMLLQDASPEINNLHNMELLDGILITAKAEQVHAHDFFAQLLAENGLQLNRNGDTWSFSRR
jgi:bla regulator protein BlaR1